MTAGIDSHMFDEFNFSEDKKLRKLHVTFISSFIRRVLYTLQKQMYCAVAMSSANGLVGTGFVSRYRFQPRAGF